MVRNGESGFLRFWREVGIKSRVCFFFFLPVFFQGLFLLQIHLLLRVDRRLSVFWGFNLVLTAGAIFQRRIAFRIYARPSLPGWNIVAAGVIRCRPNLIRSATGSVKIRLMLHC